MSYYVPDDGDWKERTSPPDPPFMEVDDETFVLRFVGGPDAFFELSGAPARSDTETVHTIAIVDGSMVDGMPLCALRAEGDDLTVEDRRPPNARTRYADAFDHLQSAMDEILIPVYIDDAIEEVSGTLEDLVVLHTAQYADPPASSCSYFRTSVFGDGTLLAEIERGSLSDR